MIQLLKFKHWLKTSYVWEYALTLTWVWYLILVLNHRVLPSNEVIYFINRFTQSYALTLFALCVIVFIHILGITTNNVTIRRIMCVFNVIVYVYFFITVTQTLDPLSDVTGVSFIRVVMTVFTFWKIDDPIKRRSRK